MVQNNTIKTAEAYHVPALLQTTIDNLNIYPDGTYVDVTFGGGGHSRELINRLGENGRLIAFDQDMDAYENRIHDKRFTFVHSNFRYLQNFLHYHGIEEIDGLVADLGVSSHHFDAQDRGFSFRFEGKLDMRMNRGSKLTAADVLNYYDEKRLSDIFYLYGEMRNARQIARTIVKQREKEPLTHTGQLLELLKPFTERDREKKDLARVFQALRIEVNQEMDALRALLESATNMMKPNGRIAILTYHSLEDRLVKNYLRSGNCEGHIEKDFYGNNVAPWRPINNKVIIADEAEIARNPRARSAKLRIAERLK